MVCKCNKAAYFHQNRKSALACWVCSWYKWAQLNSKELGIPCTKSGCLHWKLCSSGSHFCGKSKHAQGVLWNPLTSEFLLLCSDVLKLSALHQQQEILLIKLHLTCSLILTGKQAALPTENGSEKIKNLKSLHPLLMSVMTPYANKHRSMALAYLFGISNVDVQKSSNWRSSFQNAISMGRDPSLNISAFKLHPFFLCKSVWWSYRP